MPKQVVLVIKSLLMLWLVFSTTLRCSVNSIHFSCVLLFVVTNIIISMRYFCPERHHCMTMPMVFPYPRGQASAMGVINLKNCRVSVSIFDRVVKLRQTFKH